MEQTFPKAASAALSPLINNHITMALFQSALRAGASIAATLFVLSGAMLTYEVVARYFFTRPTIWAAELSQMCLIWGCMLAMPWILAAGRHIQVDAVARLLPAVGQRWLNNFVMLVIVVFSAVVTWYGFEIFYDSFERGRTTGSMLNIPIWISELSIPVGFFLLMLQALLEFFKGLSATENTGPVT